MLIFNGLVDGDFPFIAWVGIFVVFNAVMGIAQCVKKIISQCDVDIQWIREREFPIYCMGGKFVEVLGSCHLYVFYELYLYLP